MSKKEAIVADASGKDEPQPEAPGASREAPQHDATDPTPRRPVDPRQEVLERIKQTVREERAETSRPADEPVTADDFREGEEPDLAAREAAKQGDRPTEELSPVLPDGVYQKDGEFYIKAKVDGQEMEVPFKKAVANLQKYEAGDKRLQEAAMRQQELLNFQRQLQAQQQALAEQAKSRPQSSPPSDEDANKRVDAIIDNLYDGNADEAKAALRELLAQRPSAQPTRDVDPNLIAQNVIQTIRQQEQEREAAVALQQFRSEYPDVFEDRELYGLVDQIGNHVRAAHPEYGLYEVLTESAKLARNARGVPNQNAPAQERTERKRRVSPPVPGIAGRANLGEDEPPPKSYSDKIAEIKRARGQRVA